jgi:hypothetical protein
MTRSSFAIYANQLPTCPRRPVRASATTLTLVPRPPAPAAKPSLADLAAPTPTSWLEPASAGSLVAPPAPPAPPPRPVIPCETEARIGALLDAPARLGETTAVAFARKEQALGELFATLTILESRALHARLSNPRPDDPIATRFTLLVADRRARLLAFLADARRRQVIVDARTRMA